MFHVIIRTAAIAAIALLPIAASAGEVQNRIDRQDTRIHNKVEQGKLSHAQTVRLHHRVAHINRERNHELAHNHGHLTARNYKHLNRELNHTSAAIHDQSH